MNIFRSSRFTITFHEKYRAFLAGAVKKYLSIYRGFMGKPEISRGTAPAIHIMNRYSRKKNPYPGGVLVILIALFTISCGASIKDAQDFKPNKAPVISAFTVTYIGNDKSYDSSNLYSGMPFLVSITATDPEGERLSYSVSSDQGSFTSQKTTDTGITCRFFIGSIATGDDVRITLAVTDSKRASFTQTFDVGSGKSGPGITVIPPTSDILSSSGDCVTTISCDCKGIFRVYRDNTISLARQATLGTKDLIDYNSAGEEETVSLLGPSSSKTDGVVLEKNVQNRIWVVFRDNNDLTASTGFTMFVEGTNPQIISTSPAVGESNVSISPSVSFQFSKAMDSSTITSANISLRNPSGDDVRGSLSYDPSTRTGTLVPAAALAYNATYTVIIASTVTDTVGNPMPADHSFSFTTAAADSIPNVEASPIAGTYTGTKSVTLGNFDSFATIVYTTDGVTVPYITKNTDGSYTVVNGDIYSGPITANGNVTIRTLAFRNGYTASATTAHAYKIKANVPVFTKTTTDSSTGAGTLAISSATSGANIYYTIDGSDPSGTNGNLLGSIETIGINRNMTVRAIAKRSGLTDSDEKSGEYDVRAAVPAFSLATGSTVNTDTTLLLSCDSGAVIHYVMTADGTDPSDPTTASDAYLQGIVLSGSTTGQVTYKIKAMAEKTGKKDSGVSDMMTYYVNNGKNESVVFSPSGGLYYANQNVSLSCATSGAVIHYTTDGSIPTAASAVYSSPIPVAGNETMMTIKAYAEKSGMTDSDVTSAAYTVITKCDTPSLSPSPGTYTTDKSITISGYTSGATIHYTLNGSTPTPSSPVYSGPISLYSSGTTVAGVTTLTINAIAVKSGMANSGIVSGTYTLISSETGIALWSKPMTSGALSSAFNGIVTDSDGNSYAAGYVTGQEEYNFGNGILLAASTSRSADTNALIAKYNSSGGCVWAKTAAGATEGSVFSGIALDGSGNLFAVGYILGNGTFDFGKKADGSSVTIAANSLRSAGKNAFIAKYDTNGNCVWAKTIGSASDQSAFRCVTVDSSGNAYAGGSLGGQGTFDFGDNGAIAPNPDRYTGGNLLLAKYDTDGVCQRARTVTSSETMSTSVQSIAVDNSGNQYAVVAATSSLTNSDFTSSNRVVNFGNVSSSSGAQTTLEYPYFRCGSLLKIDADGFCPNAMTVTDGVTYHSDSTDNFYFNGIAANSSNIWVTGVMGPVYPATGVYYTFRKASGSISLHPVSTIYSLVAEFDGDFNCVWATQEPSTNLDVGNNCIPTQLVFDGSGSIYQVGQLRSLVPTTFDFGSHPIKSLVTGSTSFIAKYNASDGSCAWAQSLVSATEGTVFYGVSYNAASGVLCAAGLYTGNGSFNYGGKSEPFAATESSSENNAVIVRYAP